MRLVTWNCNGALRKKLNAADALGADVLIVQECEDPARSTPQYRHWAGDYLWVGENKNKGIGIFPKNKNIVRRLDWFGSFCIPGLHTTSQSISWNTADLSLFMPLTLNDSYTILACWTKGRDSQAFGYMGQFWKYLQIHREQLKSENTIIAGDFNSNAIWDKEDRWWSHSDTVKELELLGLHSLYHAKTGECQGQESIPTFFHQRNPRKPYHIDYVFISDNLLESSSLEVGAIGDWLEFSDHAPLVANID